MGMKDRFARAMRNTAMIRTYGRTWEDEAADDPDRTDNSLVVDVDTSFPDDPMGTIRL